MDEVGNIPFWRGLKTQLAVGCYGVVHKDEGTRKFTIVKDTTVVFRKLHMKLIFKTKLVLRIINREKYEKMNSSHIISL